MLFWLRPQSRQPQPPLCTALSCCPPRSWPCPPHHHALCHRTTAVPVCLGLQGCIAVLSALWAPTGSAAPEEPQPISPPWGCCSGEGKGRRKPSGNASLSPGTAPRCSHPFCSQLPALSLHGSARGVPEVHKGTAGTKLCSCQGLLRAPQGTACLLRGNWSVLSPLTPPLSCEQTAGRSPPSHAAALPSWASRTHLSSRSVFQHTADLLPQTELGMPRAAPNVLVPAPAADTRSVLSGFNPAVSLLTPHAPRPCAGTSIPTLTA